jgi:hypothetical protein
MILMSQLVMLINVFLLPHGFFCYLPFSPLYPSAKLSCFPEVKLGVNIPARGESHDLLRVDGDKNDYEWYAPSTAYATLSCINIVVVAHLGYQHLLLYALAIVLASVL